MTVPKYKIKPIKLNFNYPDGQAESRNRWTMEIEKRTGGRVHFSHLQSWDPKIITITDAMGETLVKGGRYPLIELIQTPFVFPGSRIGTKVISQLYAEFPEMRDELSDMKICGLGIGGLMAFFSSATWGPIRKIEDLKNARMRSVPQIDKVIKTLGAKPKHVGFLEISDAFEKGELDATVLGIRPSKMFHLAEHGATYCTIMGNKSITMHPLRICMKWDSWNKLPSDIQNIIDGLGPSGSDCWYASKIGLGVDHSIAESKKYFIKHGGEIYNLPKEELERWIEKVLPLRETSIKEVENQGKPGRKFMNRMLELVDIYSK